MARVFLYTKDGCPHCERQREVLRARGDEIHEINLTDSPQSVTELLKLTDGRSIVPVVVRGSQVEVAPEGGSEV